MRRVGLIFFILWSFSSFSQVTVKILESDYSQDTLAYLHECRRLVEEIVNDEEFHRSILQSELNAKWINGTNKNSSDVLNMLLTAHEIGNKKAPNGIIEFNVRRSSKSDIRLKGLSLEAKAYANPGALNINLVNESFIAEFEKGLKSETTSTLLHEYMHLLGFLHTESPGISDVADTIGELVKRWFVWQKVKKNRMIGKWKWSHSIEFEIGTHEYNLIPPSGEVLFEINKEGKVKMMNGDSVILDEVFYPTLLDRFEQGSQLPFIPTMIIRTDNSLEETSKLEILIGSNEISLPTYPYSFELPANGKRGVTYHNIFK